MFDFLPKKVKGYSNLHFWLQTIDIMWIKTIIILFIKMFVVFCKKLRFLFD